ncbi:hypothetical protein BC829DRAFT_448022 [Chytridium lagenaria]|nr:hypothetical protein BC829DRAFT_448022 [Chytridium lagenaria]
MAEDHTATASPSTSSSATQRPTSSQPVDNGSTINTTTVSTRNSRVASFASATSSGIQRRNKPVRTDSLRWSTMGGVGLLGPHGSVRGSVSASSISTSISPPQSQLSSPSQSARPVPRSSSSHPTSAISSPHQSFTTAPITLSSSLSPPHRGVSGRGSRPSSPFSVGSFGVSPFRQEMSHPSSPVGPETSSGASSTDAIKITTIQQSATPLRPRAPSAPVAVGSDEKEDERQLRRNRTLRDNGSGSLEQTLVMLRSRRATSMGPAAPLAVAAIEMAARHRSVVEVAAVAVEAAMASNVGILDSGVNLRKTREGSAKPRPLSTASSVSVARDEDGWFGRPHGGMEDEIKSRPDGMVLEVDASPPRRGVDLGERWSGINSSMTKESQTILHRGRPSSTPFSSTKPRSRSTSDGDLSPRRNALTGGTTTAAVSPSLDHVCKNLQNMMEALEAYQVGEEGSLTPPDTPGARRGGSAASLLNLYVHDEDETEVSPPRPGSLRRSKSAGIIHGREESPVRDSSPSGAINRDASKSSPVASNLFRLSKGASSVGRVGMLGRIRSGSVSSANSQTRPSSISVISPMALDVLAKSEQGTASSNPLRPSLSAPMPLSSYLSDPDLVEQSATSVPPSPSNQYPNFHYGSWRPFEARRGRGGSDSSVELVSGHEPFLSHGTGAAHGAWGELRQPYDDDLELLQEMEGFMNDADVAALEIDVDGLNDAFCEALMSGVEEGEGESGAAGLGVIVVPAAAEAVNGVAAVTSHDEGSVSPTKRAAAQYIREELSDPLVSKRGSNYFPTPALWTPARKGSGTSSISAGPGSPRVTATPARNNEAVTSTCSRMTGTPRQSFAMATDEALPSSPSGTVKRSRLERLREVMEGLEERDVMEVVKEYIAKSAIAAATAASDNLAAP